MPNIKTQKTVCRLRKPLDSFKKLKIVNGQSITVKTSQDGVHDGQSRDQS